MKSGAAVVTENAAQAVLRRGGTLELSAEEEKVMRMRLGAAPPRSAPLERVGEGLGELEIEVLAAELEAFMKLRALREREAERAARTSGRSPAAQPSRTKEKIVRALRKKT
ncbi:MAG TPA: hypothetical protein VLU43_05760 [Anaeromyxobacteraceae bacterium]|nr:hypothetical protein [Anaeromyxobacteraceae bacterium]